MTNVARKLYLFMLHQHRLGRSPTLREMATFMGYRSTNAVREHLVRLRDEGLVKNDPNVARAWVPVRRPPRDRCGWRFLEPNRCGCGATYFGDRCAMCALDAVGGIN